MNIWGQGEKNELILSFLPSLTQIHAPTYNCLFPFTPVFTSIKADEGHLLLNYEKSEDQVLWYLLCRESTDSVCACLW